MPSVVSYSPPLVASDNLITNVESAYTLEYADTKPFNDVLPSVISEFSTSDFVTEPRLLPLTLDAFPTEILQNIFSHVLITSGEDGQRHLARLLSVCFKFYQIGIPLLYSHARISYSRSFGVFRQTLEETGFGAYVKVLNFSSFTSVGLGRTGNMNKEIQNLTSSSIQRVLELCPNLSEFLSCESVDPDIDTAVLDGLASLPQLHSLDFCGSTRFTPSLLTANFVQMTDPLPALKNVSFHCCSAIPSKAFGRILSRLVNLEKLDLTHTQITSEDLFRIPETAKLTHLSVGQCNKLCSGPFMRFLLLHPAARSLTWLNIMFDASKPYPLSEEDFETILKYLPKTLEYINLYGSPFKEEYLKYLEKLENLAGLSLGFSDLSAEVLYRCIPQFKNLRYLDLTGNTNISLWVLHDDNFYKLNPKLEVVELSKQRIEKISNMTLSPGWRAKTGQGRRGWLYRVNEDQAPIKPTTSQTRSGISFKPRMYRGSGRMLDRIQFSDAPVQLSSPVTVESLEAWMLYASRKINMNEIGTGGYQDTIALKQLGLHAYYGYHLN